MIYFNFHDLQINCEDQIPAIFVLTVGLGLGYNKFRFKNLHDFRKKCIGLVDIPYILYKRGLIIRDGESSRVVTYRTKYPQSYISNTDFLFIDYPFIKKVQYVKLLSYRPIGNNSNWIPADYLEDLNKIRNNALLDIKHDKIYFKYEGK